MNDTLKAAGRIGAELGAAKAEVQLERERHRKTWRQLEQVRGLLREALNEAPEMMGEEWVAAAKAALSKQAEPVCDWCAGAGHDFYGDKCIYCRSEPAPAQDERELMELIDQRDSAEEWANKLAAAIAAHTGADIGEHSNMNCPWAEALEAIENARPAQTEQQPVTVPESWWQTIHDTLRNYRMGTLDDGHGDGYPLIDAMTADGQSVSGGIEECTYLADAIWNSLLAAPIAQTAPQPEQSGLVEMVDRAMVEMRNIHPPMRRSDCERLIRAALSAQGTNP